MPWWRVSGAPASRPVPCTTLNTPAGRPGLVGDVRQQGRGQRRPLRRLEHHGVPRRQRRPDAPGGEHQRGIPRRDDGGDTGRVVGDPLAVPADLRRRGGRAVQVVGEEAEVHRDPRHDAAPVRAQQRAVVAGLDPRQVLGPLVDAVGDRVQDVGPLAAAAAPPRPGRRPAPRRPRRRPRAGPPRVHLRDGLLVDRGDVGEGAAPRRPAGRRSSAGCRRTRPRRPRRRRRTCCSSGRLTTGLRGQSRQQPAAVPDDADLAVVAADDLVDGEPGRVPRWGSRRAVARRRRSRPARPRIRLAPDSISSA